MNREMCILLATECNWRARNFIPSVFTLRAKSKVSYLLFFFKVQSFYASALFKSSMKTDGVSFLVSIRRKFCSRAFHKVLNEKKRFQCVLWREERTCLPQCYCCLQLFFFFFPTSNGESKQTFLRLPTHKIFASLRNPIPSSTFSFCLQTLGPHKLFEKSSRRRFRVRLWQAHLEKEKWKRKLSSKIEFYFRTTKPNIFS